MRGRVAHTRRESSSKVDMLILVVMVALFLLTMTITFSPANFPSREYHDNIPINNHLDFVTERDRAVQAEAEKRAKHEADERTRQEAVRKAEQEAEARRRQEEEERLKEVEARRLQEAEEAERRRQEEEDARRRQEEEKQKQQEQAQQQQQQQPASQESLEDVFRQNLAKEMEADKQNWDARRKLMAVNPKTLGDEWVDDTEAACSQEDCPWKGPYLDGKAFQQEKAGCDPRSRQCACLQDWGAKDKCPESFPEDKRVTIAVTGWLLDFMGRYVEGDYDCPHSAPRVVNFESMDKSKENPDIYLSSDVPFIEKRWKEMREAKQQLNKTNSKMALLYIEAEPHVGHWFGTLPELDISLTFYDWADIHLTHIQDHPSWFRNAPYPFHLKRNITFINTGCYGHRTAIVEEVMKYLPVENLGACLKNADYCELFPYCCRTPFHGSYTSRYVEKECLIHHYKFVLALENTVSFNYTTEKFFQPMKMGTVPVYWGSNSSKPLMPGDHAVIRVDDFPSIKDLAAYMKELLEDENKYNKHLEWKYKPFRKSFLEEAKDGLSTFVCRMADAYKLGKTFYGSTRMPGYGVKKF